MTQEIKLKLEQAAETHLTDRHGHTLDAARKEGFMEGAQTILDAPGEWGLKSIDDYADLAERHYYLELERNSFKDEIDKMQSQLTKYREALDKVHKIVMYDLSEPIQEIIDVVEGVLYEGE